MGTLSSYNNLINNLVWHMHACNWWMVGFCILKNLVSCSVKCVPPIPFQPQNYSWNQTDFCTIFKLFNYTLIISLKMFVGETLHTKNESQSSSNFITKKQHKIVLCLPEICMRYIVLFFFHIFLHLIRVIISFTTWILIHKYTNLSLLLKIKCIPSMPLSFY